VWLGMKCVSDVSRCEIVEFVMTLITLGVSNGD
jgi:hypothetical protein